MSFTLDFDQVICAAADLGVVLSPGHFREESETQYSNVTSQSGLCVRDTFRNRGAGDDTF